MYRIIILLLTACIALPVVAQEKKDFAWYNSETYALYLDHNWNMLIQVGEEAIEAGHDFFYMRVRLGAAYYGVHQYRKAIPQFSKALEFNADDPLTSEYLYYSYVFSGRYYDANLVWEKYKAILKSRNIKSPNAFITGMYTEGGVKFSSKNEEGIGNITNFHIGVSQQWGARLHLYQGYTRVTQTFSEYIYYSYGGGMGPPRTYVQEIKHRYPQNEYYIKADVPIIKGLLINGSFHSQSFTDSTDERVNNKGYTIGLKQNNNISEIYLGYAASDINHLSQVQYMAGVTFYPLGSPDLYMQALYTYHEENQDVNNVYFLKLGGKVANKLWFDGYGSIGGMKKFQELEGLLMYNIPNKINYRWGVTGSLYMGKTGKLMIGYMLENKQENIESNLTFNHNYLYVGLHFIFKKR